MITDLFLTIAYWLIGNTFIKFLPIGTPVNSSLLTYMTEMGEKIRIFDPVLPIDIMYNMITIILTVEIILLTLKVWNYIRTYIPFLH